MAISSCQTVGTGIWLMTFVTLSIVRGHLFGAYLYYDFAFNTSPEDQLTYTCGDVFTTFNRLVGYYEQCQFFVQPVILVMMVRLLAQIVESKKQAHEQASDSAVSDSLMGSINLHEETDNFTTTVPNTRSSSVGKIE